MSFDKQDRPNPKGLCVPGIGTSVATTDIGVCVGIIWSYSENEEDECEILTPLPAAKALLIDLRDAIVAAEKLANGDDLEGEEDF